MRILTVHKGNNFLYRNQYQTLPPCWCLGGGRLDFPSDGTPDTTKWVSRRWGFAWYLSVEHWLQVCLLQQPGRQRYPDWCLLNCCVLTCRNTDKWLSDWGGGVICLWRGDWRLRKVSLLSGSSAAETVVWWCGSGGEGASDTLAREKVFFFFFYF